MEQSCQEISDLNARAAMDALWVHTCAQALLTSA